MALFRAFGVEPPKYAHIPLILNSDGTKMSKRDRGASLATYLEEGYPPEALVNYLCLLGWSPKGNREVMTLPEIIGLFDLPQILRHNARFDYTKLSWLCGEYLRTMKDDRYYELAVHALSKAGLDTNRFALAYVKAALDTGKQKIKKFSAWVDFYFKDEMVYDREAAQKDFVPENKPRLEKLREAFARLASFDAITLETTLKAMANEIGVKVGVLVHPTRLACTGKPIGPSLYHLLEVLGKDRVLQRMDRALAKIA
jgi:glutamyl-tRNA synthetase